MDLFLAQLQRTVLDRLKANDVDQEVKETVILCQGTSRVWSRERARATACVHPPSAPRAMTASAWPVACAGAILLHTGDLFSDDLATVLSLLLERVWSAFQAPSQGLPPFGMSGRAKRVLLTAAAADEITTGNGMAHSCGTR